MARGDGKQAESVGGATLRLRAGPWLSWLGLWAVLELPALGLPEPVRPSGEALLLLTALLAAGGLGRGRSRRLAFGVWTLLVVLLCVYRLDRLIFHQAFGDEPLLYDQLFMVRHLFVLIGDTWSAWIAVLLVVCLAALVGLGRVIQLLARAALPLASPERRRTTALVLAGAWIACAVGSALPPGSKPKNRWAVWGTPALVHNVRKSAATYSRVNRDVARSPYRQYASLRFARRPDVFLVMVESYGRVMVEHELMRAPWAVQVERMERSLSAAGWHAASAFTRAPVLGGRSWLAEATVLMGARVRYEAVFHQLIAQIDRVPTLHGLLRAQGYRRVLLAPADRVRPGVEEADYYRYDRSVRFAELNYRGPRVGWGIVPDQYSLEYFAKHVLPAVPQPRFVDFHMVSSHAPWEQIPELVDDFETLNRAAGPTFSEQDATSLRKRLKRYLHEGDRFQYSGTLREGMAKRYRDAILYDLQVLERYLLTVRDDALVILLGDHQPPFISAETTSFDTPIHVLARDPKLLLELEAQGFTPGLRLRAGQPAALRHEALFSLLARSLARASDLPPGSWPRYRPTGARLGD